jgi:hypothetical protein
MAFPCSPMPSTPASKAQHDRAAASFDLLWKDAIEEYDLAVVPPASRERVTKHIQMRALTRACQWLASAMGIEVQNFDLSKFDAERLAQVEQLCRNVSHTDVRHWAKSRGL